MENADQTFIDCWSLISEILEKLKDQNEIVNFEQMGGKEVLRGKSFFKAYYYSRKKRLLWFRLLIIGLPKYSKSHHVLNVSVNTCLLEKNLFSYIKERLPEDRKIIIKK